MEFVLGLAVVILLTLLALLVWYQLHNRSDTELNHLMYGVRAEEQLKSLQYGVETGLKDLRDSVTKVTEVVNSVDRARAESIANLAAVVSESSKSVSALSETTAKLNLALSSSQARGQWGEKMADDLLTAAGFLEGVQYKRQAQMSDGTARPDFTFVLPQNRVLNMDVKFPFDAYRRSLEAGSDEERDRESKQFINDVRGHIKSVSSRDYIDESSGTLSYALLFIPNEQLYRFIYENDPGAIDYAMELRIVLCSPVTLFAILGVIRQSVDNFYLAQRTDEILSALGAFYVQWGKYKEKMDILGNRLNSARKAYDEVVGARTRQLDRQVEKVERLRIETGIEPDEIEESDVPSLQETDSGRAVP